MPRGILAPPLSRAILAALVGPYHWLRADDARLPDFSWPPGLRPGLGLLNLIVSRGARRFGGSRLRCGGAAAAARRWEGFKSRAVT